MFLLDTNVISELLRVAPDPLVERFVRGLAHEHVFTSAICEAELRYGLARMPSGLRRTDLAQRIDAWLGGAFDQSILVFDGACAAAYADLRASREAKGDPIALGDAMIAATAYVHGAALVTRNTRHFADCGIVVINPWMPSPP